MRLSVRRFLSITLPCGLLGLLVMSAMRARALAEEVERLELENARRAAGGVGSVLRRRNMVTVQGESIVLGRGAPSTELVFFSPNCPHCKAAAPGWAGDRTSSWGARRVFVARDSAGVREFLESFHIDAPAVVDSERALADAVGCRLVPSRFLVDSRGIVLMDDEMLRLAEAKGRWDVTSLPEGVERELIQSLGATLLPDAEAWEAIDLTGRGRRTFVYEGRDGIVGFGQLLSRSIATPECSDLEVFVAYDRDSRLVGVLPLLEHASHGTAIPRAQFEEWARDHRLAAWTKEPLRSAFFGELLAFERELRPTGNAEDRTPRERR